MKWEYYRFAAVESTIDEALAKLGQEGWELVAVLPETRYFHGFHCVLKRSHSGKEGHPPHRAVTPHRFSQYIPDRSS